jgi:ribonuclease HII
MKPINTLTVKQIKNEIDQLTLDEAEKFIPVLEADERKSINKLANKIKRAVDAVNQEKERIKSLWAYEKEITANYTYVAGIDEVGRGPLAGPVVCAAVILEKGTEFIGINDSKKVKKEDRERLFNEIKEKAIAVGIGICDEKVIDAINILEATKLGMKKAIKDLEQRPEFLLIDALTLDDIPIKQKGIIKGDTKSVSIAAASIIAKVTRDQIMYAYNEKYPEYGFLTNVGYGTKEHREALEIIGPTPIHRKSFIKNII